MTLIKALDVLLFIPRDLDHREAAEIEIYTPNGLVVGLCRHGERKQTRTDRPSTGAVAEKSIYLSVPQPWRKHLRRGLLICSVQATPPTCDLDPIRFARLIIIRKWSLIDFEARRSDCLVELEA